MLDTKLAFSLVLDSVLSTCSTMSSHIILEDDCTLSSVGPRSKNNRILSPSITRYFVVPRATGGHNYIPPNTSVSFWEIRQRVPPSDDIIAHAGDTYLDISTDPVGVYQNTSTGWISCWSESATSSKKEFIKLPHPRFKDRFLWTTKSSCNEDIWISYITQEELNSTRGGTEEDKQDCLLKDIDTFRPITTAHMLVARRNSKANSQDTSLDSLDSNSSSLTIGNDSDSMYVEEERDNGDGDGDEDEDDDDDDGDGSGDDEELSTEVVSGGDSVDKANKDSASCKIAEIAELAQTILEEVVDISSMTLNLVKYPASGNGDSSTQPFASNGPPGIFPSSSSTSYVPPKFESDSIHSLLSRLTATIDKERQEHIMKINNCE